MPPQETGHDFPDLAQNYRGGLKLLHLATEQVGNAQHCLSRSCADLHAHAQVRIFDPTAAEQISRGFLQPLQFWFERAISSAAHQSHIGRDHDAARQLQHMGQVSQDAWSQDIKPRMPPTPPGLGFDKLGFQEARPTTKSGSAMFEGE